jgi:hypothetical protein
MRIKEKLRYYWHELYYKLASPSAVDFAMRCKDVTELIDLGTEELPLVSRIRLRLHLSFCQACCYYKRASDTLRRIAREMLIKSDSSINFELLKEELLEKYARKRSK